MGLKVQDLRDINELNSINKKLMFMGVFWKSVQYGNVFYIDKNAYLERINWIYRFKADQAVIQVVHTEHYPIGSITPFRN